MATPNDVNTPPHSGLQHIDALLDTGPGWNWLTPTRTTLYYTFALGGADTAGSGLISGAASTMNVAQQAAVTNLLNYVATVTGITFALTADANQADLHFVDGNITAAGTAGYTHWSWSYQSNIQTITSYTADAFVFMDTTDFGAANLNPTQAGGGYEILLHEIGHALGLKHPFDGSTTLPAGQDDTAHTLMSYTHVGGPYGSYQSYDIDALMFLYGGDGLGGLYGQGAPGLYLIGTSTNETLTGGSGNDMLEGGGGNDVILGDAGDDTARFSGLRSQYTITTLSDRILIVGPDGSDTLMGVEFARFTDMTVQLASTPTNHAPTGSLTVGGSATQGVVLTAVSTLADADGMGSLSYQWQSSADGSTWADVGGAKASTLTPGEALVGLQLRVQASYTDGLGKLESATSAATGAVANVNDPPVGSVSISGTPKIGSALQGSAALTDADGLGTLLYRWQVQSGPTWVDIAGASSASFTPTALQAGQVLRLQVNYVDGHGTIETVNSTPTAAVDLLNHAPTGAVTIGGTVQQGQALTANTGSLADADGLGSFHFQWQSSAGGGSWSNIAGATASAYTPGEAQVGLLLRVAVSYTDGGGSAESLASAATAAVANTNDAPTGRVQIGGNAVQGSSLSATHTLADADGLGAIAYTWEASTNNGASWNPINGATASSFTPGLAQVGSLLRVQAHYVDGHGSSESVASAATAAVAGYQLGGPGKDILVGTAFADTLVGADGDDRLTGGGGNDTLQGGAGLDSAVYALPRAQYTVGAKAASVVAGSGSEGSDTLSGIERLVFSDQSLAFDMSGHAGTTARYLGAVFGPASVANLQYAGIGVMLLDTGVSNNDLMQLALDAKLGGGFSAAAEIGLLYQNLLGQAPSADELAFWTAALNSGQYTAVSLAQMAANLDLNAANIGLAGLADTGLAYVLPG
ncbi:hypothetical protein [Aquabacterium sp.]|uniref:hypothetical protein n=1 Tax=Aquabacterium sp. TaxID=1872578 RepID=UPI0037850C99